MSIKIHFYIFVVLIFTVLLINSSFSTKIDNAEDDMNSLLELGLKRASINAYSNSCKSLIKDHLMLHIQAAALEEAYPFETISYQSQCSDSRDYSNMTQTWLLKHNITAVKENPVTPINTLNDPSELSIAYIMLVHSNVNNIIRIAKALLIDEPNHILIIHVDLPDHNNHNKNNNNHNNNNHDDDNDSLFKKLVLLIMDDITLSTQVFLVPTSKRVSCVWGGYSIVQATLNSMELAMILHKTHPFHYMIDLR